ncbi:MAG: hypothetical protein K1X61_08355 [Chitinophagales bacterium]|nr:hypothetical protein [Chitinophagales bacterium]
MSTIKVRYEVLLAIAVSLYMSSCADKNEPEDILPVYTLTSGGTLVDIAIDTSYAAYDTIINNTYVAMGNKDKNDLLEFHLSNGAAQTYDLNKPSNKMTYLSASGNYYESSAAGDGDYVDVTALDLKKPEITFGFDATLYNIMNPADSINLKGLGITRTLVLYGSTPGTYARLSVDGVQHEYSTFNGTIDVAAPLTHLNFADDPQGTEVDIFVSASQEGLYPLDFGPFSFSISEGNEVYSSSFSPGSGVIEITDIDDVNMMIEGYFNGTVVNTQDANDSWLVTDGVFRIPYQN